MAEISIQEVLSTMRDDATHQFSLKIVRSSGKVKKGTIKTIERARYGKNRAKSSSNSKRTNSHKSAGTIPITDVMEDQYLTPLISHIIYFNNKKVIH